MRQVEIFRFWLPLFASWTLMTAEGPLISTAINRLPNEVVMLAAFGVAIALAVLIESPIMNLLTTATALVEDRASFLLLRRFTLHWMIGLTVVSAVVATNPLFDLVVRRAMGVPADVAGPVRDGLIILIPWSAAIAWRRFLQGVLIRFDRTQLIAWGTALRLVVSVGVAVGLAMDGRFSGIQIGASALVLGVIAEAFYATWAVRPLYGRELAPGTTTETTEPLTYAAVARYHLPLASTAALTLLMQPLVSLTLARLAQPTQTLAAWPLVFHAMLLMRSMALALPEVVIALLKRAGSYPALRRFSHGLAAVNLGAMVLLVATPLAQLYLLRIQNTTETIAQLAYQGFLLLLPLPFVFALLSWYRALMMAARETGAVHTAMVIRLSIFLPCLAIGVWLDLPGMATAAMSVNLSVIAECLYLAVRSREERRRLALASHPSG